MCNLFTVYSEFFIFHIAKANLGPFQISTMDFFLQKISSYLFSRLLNPPLQCRSYFDIKMWKLQMIIQNWGMSFGKIPSYSSKGIINPRLPHILLNVVFPSDLFYDFAPPGNIRSDSVLWNTFLFSISSTFCRN